MAWPGISGCHSTPQRYLTSGGGFADGERDGGQWFASVSAGKKFEIESCQISPYARLDVTVDAWEQPVTALRSRRSVRSRPNGQP
ncbi:autotransporter domain-containing protein [Mesorhizobium sp. ES1-4]|uniref:autotransporter domain-containing protein n=1 Tax=Mesorhizobium sp. ES1-4 TaxID=2876627 RepID=UPI001CCA7228|nr:autotransporter domain-containing protein [Mesorhizobium sp. ES1-4]MBZ9800032.1 autotransporter domain-containing protein [Mesorhizobium sp. ES1-4]